MGEDQNKHKDALEVNGTLRIESTDTGFGLCFVGSEYSLGVKKSGTCILQKGLEGTSIRDRIFEVCLEFSKDRSTLLSKEFRFDNVDVFPDNDNQKLGRPENRWEGLYAKNGSFSGSLHIDISKLKRAPANAQTVELVVDKNTGEVYCK